jgi:hypothetical protein
VTDADEADVWVEGTLEINTNAVGDVPAGGLALAGDKPLFSAVKAGYAESDQGGSSKDADDLDDSGDNLAVNETFVSTTITPTYAEGDQGGSLKDGNLTFDGTYKYTYDVWPLTRRPGGCRLRRALFRVHPASRERYTVLWFYW